MFDTQLFEPETYNIQKEINIFKFSFHVSSHLTKLTPQFNTKLVSTCTYIL